MIIIYIFAVLGFIETILIAIALYILYKKENGTEYEKYERLTK